MGEWSPKRGPELVFKWDVATVSKSFRVKAFYAGQEFLEHELGVDELKDEDLTVPRLSFSLRDENHQPLTSGTLLYIVSDSPDDWYELKVEELTYGRVPLNDHVLERCQESVVVIAGKKPAEPTPKSASKRRSAKKRSTRQSAAGKGK